MVEIVKDAVHRIESYSVAGLFPAKLLQGETLRKGRIVPRHVQIYLTNACNLDCSFCSCADRKLTERIPPDEIEKILPMLASLGTEAITLSGGGEPSLHPAFNRVIDLAHAHGIRVGLVSHGGLLWKRLESKNLTWARISRSDVMDQSGDYFSNLSGVVRKFSNTDWAFSYVLMSEPIWDKMREAVRFAGEHGFKHVRIVSDLLDLPNVPSMDEVKFQLAGVPGEEIVIYQGRKGYTVGREKCLISLLKPVIAADGRLFPCCGAQYALPESKRDTVDEMCMGRWEDMPRIWGDQANFNGSACVRCYYDGYNQALDYMTMPLAHKEFV